MPQRIVVESVRPAPHGFAAEVVGLATAKWTPDEFTGPIVFTRWAQGKDGKEGRAWPVARIVGAGAVQLIDVQIRRGTNGRAPFATVNGIEVPAEVLREIARIAVDMLEIHDHADANDPNRAAAGPRGNETGGAPPF